MYSIIDDGLHDFIRDEIGKPFYFSSYEAAEGWLKKNGALYGWTNTGTRYFNWDED